MKKKVVSIAVLMVLLISIMTPLTRTGASGMSISKKKATLEVDAVLTLKVIGNTDGSAVKWSSSKKSVAKVSKKGKVTAKSEGTATITAKVGSEKYECVVTVVDSNKEDTITDTPTSTEPKIDISDFEKKYFFKAPYKPVAAHVQFTSVDCEIRDFLGDIWYIDIKYTATSENALSEPYSDYVTYWFDYQVLDDEGYMIDSGIFPLSDMDIDGKIKKTFSIHMEGEKGSSYSVTLKVNRMIL